MWCECYYIIKSIIFKVYFSFLNKLKLISLLTNSFMYTAQLSLFIKRNISGGCSVLKKARQFSFVDFFAGIISIAPSLSFTLSGTSAFPWIFAFSGSEPVLRFIDVTVYHKLSWLFIFLPWVSVKVLFVIEKFSEVFWELLGGWSFSAWK